jgi:hypothetical protein
MTIPQSPLSIQYHQGEKKRDGDLSGLVTAMRDLRKAFRNLQGKLEKSSHLDERGINGRITLK